MLTPALRRIMTPVCASLVLLLLLTALGQAQDGPYQVSLQHNVMVPMRDGVRLAADVYLPT